MKPCFCLFLGVFGIVGIDGMMSDSHSESSPAHDDEVTRTVVTECGTVMIRPNAAKQAPYHTPVAPRAILASPRHVVSATHCAAQLHACTKNQLDGIYCQVAFVSVVF